MKNLKKEDFLFLLAAVLLYLLFSLIAIKQLNSSFFSNWLILDEKSYVVNAVNLLEKGMPEKPFYQAPLYPFLITGLFKITGFSINAIRMFHVFCGIATLITVFLISRMLFQKKASTISALLMLFSGIFYYYQSLILKVSVSLLFFVLFIYCFLLYMKKSRYSFLILSALFLSILSQFRENALVLILAPIVCVFYNHLSFKKKILSVLIFLTIFLLALSPVAYFNSKVSKTFMLTSSQAGHNFYIGNNPASYGRYTTVKGVASNPFYQEQAFSEIAKEETGSTQGSFYWFKKAYRDILKNKKQFLKLILLKICLFFNDYEIPNNRNFYFERHFFSPSLYFFPVSFGMLLPFAIIGIYHCFLTKRTECIFLTIVFLLYFLSTIFFYVLSRYRVLIWPVIILFAAEGLALYFLEFRRRDLKKICKLSILIIFVYLFTFHIIEVEGHLNPFPTFSRTELMKKEFSYVLFNMGITIFNQKEYEKAKGIFQTLNAINPDYTASYYLLAKSYFELKNYHKMLECYSVVLKRKKELMTPEDFTILKKYQKTEEKDN